MNICLFEISQNRVGLRFQIDAFECHRYQFRSGSYDGITHGFGRAEFSGTQKQTRLEYAVGYGECIFQRSKNLRKVKVKKRLLFLSVRDV